MNITPKSQLEKTIAEYGSENLQVLQYCERNGRMYLRTKTGATIARVSKKFPSWYELEEINQPSINCRLYKFKVAVLIDKEVKNG